MKIKLAPFVENACESGFACLLTMVQGNVLVLGVSHWIVASQTGLLTGAIAAAVATVASSKRKWAVALVLGVTTTAVDAVVHLATLGAASLLEAAVTGVGAFVLSLAAGAALRRWNGVRRRAAPQAR